MLLYFLHRTYLVSPFIFGQGTDNRQVSVTVLRASKQWEERKQAKRRDKAYLHFLPCLFTLLKEVYHTFA
jgi:hypothetical protein